jgi:hypothetical protein
LDLDLATVRLFVALVREAVVRDLAAVFLTGAFAEVFADAFGPGFDTAARFVEVLDLGVAPQEKLAATASTSREKKGRGEFRIRVIPVVRLALHA